jgi:hypothetical protein
MTWTVASSELEDCKIGLCLQVCVAGERILGEWDAKFCSFLLHASLIPVRGLRFLASPPVHFENQATTCFII